MAYLAHIHRPTSVRHALKLNLLSPDEECLVLAKANRLEIYTQTQDGLALSHSRTLYGKVTMVERLRPSSSTIDHLFVGTDRYMYFTISWDAQSRQLRTEKNYQGQADKTSRDSQTEDQCLIDPTRRFMALMLFDGIVTIIPMAQKGKKRGSGDLGTLGDPVPTRISDLFVRSAAFSVPSSRRQRTSPACISLRGQPSKSMYECAETGLHCWGKWGSGQCRPRGRSRRAE